MANIDYATIDIFGELKEDIDKKFGLCWKAIRKAKWCSNFSTKPRNKTYGRWNK